MEGELDDFAVIGLDKVRCVVVHKAGVVDDAALGEKGHGAVAGVAAGDPVAGYLLSGGLFEGLEPPVQVFDLLFESEFSGPEVHVAVAGNLVAPGNDLSYKVGVLVGGEAGDEEGGLKSVFIHEVKDSRDSDLWGRNRRRS